MAQTQHVSTPAVAAIVLGAVLAGAMLSLSLCAVPVILDTNTETAHILSQWVRLYHYGHLLMPAMAICTFLLYSYSALQHRQYGTEARWKKCAAAAVVTVTMIPFTLAIMVPTNDTLFRLQLESREDPAKNAVSEDVRALVVRWSWMHVTRSCFPLMGAVIGMSAFTEDLTVALSKQALARSK